MAKLHAPVTQKGLESRLAASVNSVSWSTAQDQIFSVTKEGISLVPAKSLDWFDKNGEAIGAILTENKIRERLHQEHLSLKQQQQFTELIKETKFRVQRTL